MAKKIIKGLKQAIAFVKGDKSKGRIYHFGLSKLLTEAEREYKRLPKEFKKRGRRG